MDTPLDLTGRYKEKTIHKFLKDDILDIIRSQNAVFQPFFDPETYPDLELIIVDGKIRDSYLPVSINSPYSMGDTGKIRKWTPHKDIKLLPL